MAERLPSIRQRLSRTLIIVSVVWGLAVAVVVGMAVGHEVDEILDGALREAAQILLPLLATDAFNLPMGDAQIMLAAPHKEEVIWQVVDVQRGVLLRSHDAPAHPMVAVEYRDIVKASNGWRVLVAEFGTPDRLLMVAQIGSERREAKMEAIEYTVGGALLVGALCALWLRSRVRRELLPLTDLKNAVAQFDPLRRGAHMAQVSRQELLPVRDAIASLGARLAARVTHERAFAAHAAHALRTPLAGMMAQLAAAQRLCPEDAQPMLGLARQAADRLRRVVSAILTLFRSGSEVKWQLVDLAALLPQLQADDLLVSVELPAELAADPNLLAAALANLLDNALRHGATRVRVEVRALDKGFSCLSLQDDGPGIPEDQRVALQSALDAQAYQNPVGMGLMLADLVARAHGGALRLPPSAAGCRVEMMIGPGPTAAQAPSSPTQPPLASRW